jgi:hypothetical protein
MKKNMKKLLVIALALMPGLSISTFAQDGGEGAGTYPAGRMAQLRPSAAQGWQFDHWHDNDEPDPESADYEFDHWSDGVTSNPRNVFINKSRNLSAVFYSIYEETLNIEVECGRCYEDGDTHCIGEQVQIKVIPRPGFLFRCWADDPTAGATRTILIQECMPTLHAVCESDDTYTVECIANPSNAGTVTGGATGLHYGDVLQIQTIPNEGYRFVEWVDDDEAPAIRTFAVTEDLALEAYFEEIPPEE